MRSRRHSKSFSCRLLLLLVPLLLATAAQAASENAFSFMKNGAALSVDVASLSLTVLGHLSPAAPTVDRDPNGLYWGRLGTNTFAALDPRTGDVVCRIALPYRVYNAIIAPNGKAYVTHHTVTPHGFTVSVVDTARRKMIGEIQGISGLRTDLIQAGGFVYLATIGVEKEDSLTLALYRIDTRDDTLREIRRFPRQGYYWQLAAADGFLFISYTPRTAGSGEPKIEVMNLETLRVVRTVTPSQLGLGGRGFGKLSFFGGKGYLPCSSDAGTQEIVVTDPSVSRVLSRLPLPGPIDRLVGVAEETVVYLEGASLHIYDSGTRREEKRIPIPD